MDVNIQSGNGGRQIKVLKCVLTKVKAKVEVSGKLMFFQCIKTIFVKSHDLSMTIDAKKNTDQPKDSQFAHRRVMSAL